jgi:hypothetical protein
VGVKTPFRHHAHDPPPALPPHNLPGVAVFKGVKLAADAPGTFTLRAASATRKVAVADAAVSVAVVPHNFVSGLEVAAAGLPEEGAPVGAAHTLQVDVATEDGQPLAWDAAAAGFQLRLEPAPDPDAPKGEPRPEPIVLVPDEAATRAAVEAAAGAGGEGGGGGGGGGPVCFVTPPLTGAGRYRVTAQFTETRPELLQALPKAVGGRCASARPWARRGLAHCAGDPRVGPSSTPLPPQTPRSAWRHPNNDRTASCAAPLLSSPSPRDRPRARRSRAPRRARARRPSATRRSRPSGARARCWAVCCACLPLSAEVPLPFSHVTPSS